MHIHTVEMTIFDTKILHQIGAKNAPMQQSAFGRDVAKSALQHPSATDAISSRSHLFFGISSSTLLSMLLKAKDALGFAGYLWSIEIASIFFSKISVKTFFYPQLKIVYRNYSEIFSKKVIFHFDKLVLR